MIRTILMRDLKLAARGATGTGLSLAFMALVSDPYIESPAATFFLLLIAATAAMAYHWFFSRYQRSSNFGQLLQFCFGLLPVICGFCIVLISRGP